MRDRHKSRVRIVFEMLGDLLHIAGYYVEGSVRWVIGSFARILRTSIPKGFRDRAGWIKWVILMAALGTLVGALLVGLTWFSAHALPWINTARDIALLFSILVFLPMLVFKRSRHSGATCLFFASYVFGLDCWVVSFIFTYAILGVFWLLVGLLMFGVGVFPMALIALALHRAWGPFWFVLRLFGLMVVARTISGIVLEHCE
jgi:hypothetical protein